MLCCSGKRYFPILMAIRLDYVCDLLQLMKFGLLMTCITSQHNFEEPAGCFPSLFPVLTLPVLQLEDAPGGKWSSATGKIVF